MKERIGKMDIGFRKWDGVFFPLCIFSSMLIATRRITKCFNYITRNSKGKYAREKPHRIILSTPLKEHYSNCLSVWNGRLFLGAERTPFPFRSQIRSTFHLHRRINIFP